MYGLDLFSGYGGLTEALAPWVSPVAYCEIERYAQGILLSRQIKGQLPIAPVWDDIRTLTAKNLPHGIDIVYGGFPCQDLSIAGRRAGLAGKRSGLFFEIARIVGEIRPAFVFMENVPHIRSTGADVVTATMASLRYDCRWGVLSAADVGANHLRERWWLLAHAMRPEQRREQRQSETKADAMGHTVIRGCSREPRGGAGTKFTDGYFQLEESHTNANGDGCQQQPTLEAAQTGEYALSRFGGLRQDVADAQGVGIQGLRPEGKQEPEVHVREGLPKCNRDRTSGDWWSVEPNVGRVVNGCPRRCDRIRALGNGVVPAQAREAFKRLMGFR